MFTGKSQYIQETIPILDWFTIYFKSGKTYLPIYLSTPTTPNHWFTSSKREDSGLPHIFRQFPN